MIPSCRHCLVAVAGNGKGLLGLRKFGNKVKLIGQLDENIQQAVERSDLKPRRHPGRIKNNIHEFPNRLYKSMQIVLKDQPIKVLCEEGASLNRYLNGRHPPRTPEEIKKQPKGYQWRPIEYEGRTCLQYLVGRVGADYSILRRIFAEFTSRMPHFNPKAIFDFGSGVGTVPWAAQETWGNSLKEIYCVDASSDMNDLAELLLRGGTMNGELPCQGTFFRQFLPASYDRQYDIVTSAFSLFEMSSMEARLSTLHNLWSKTKQYLVLVELGTNAGFKLIDEAREFIMYISKSKEEMHIFAPCPHESVCPRVQRQDGTPCNFEIGYTPMLTHNAQVQREKFCYLILGKGPRPEKLSAWPRVVRPVLNRSKHTVCRLCMPSGNLQEIILTASKDSKATYRCAKVSEWGDLLPINIVTSDVVVNSDETHSIQEFEEIKPEK